MELSVMFLIFLIIAFFIIPKVTDKDEILLQSQGPISSQVICPHCQVKGQVRTKIMKRKKGISGVKATGAVLTMGISILATGLSRKEDMTHATCGNCGSVWDF